jgi:hypothetical protein
MSTYITKTWLDGEKVVTQEISESEVYKQEPVAWRYDQAKYRTNDLRGRQWAFNVFSQTRPYIDEMVQNVTPLYTTPPAAQRTWVGLTDEEVQEIMEKTVATCSELDDFTGDTARLTWKNCEAKLREKNGG